MINLPVHLPEDHEHFQQAMAPASGDQESRNEQPTKYKYVKSTHE